VEQGNGEAKMEKWKNGERNSYNNFFWHVGTRARAKEYPILIVHHLFGFQFIAFFNVDGFPWPSVGRGAAIRLLRTAPSPLIRVSNSRKIEYDNY
jgi:hypothetical protein